MRAWFAWGSHCVPLADPSGVCGGKMGSSRTSVGAWPNFPPTLSSSKYDVFGGKDGAAVQDPCSVLGPSSPPMLSSPISFPLHRSLTRFIVLSISIPISSSRSQTFFLSSSSYPFHIHQLSHLLLVTLSLFRSVSLFHFSGQSQPTRTFSFYRSLYASVSFPVTAHKR